MIGFGRDGQQIVDACGQPHYVTTLDEALDLALSMAQPHDAVLLSPACASFDQFDNFAARGDAFEAMVAQRQEGA